MPDSNSSFNAASKKEVDFTRRLEDKMRLRELEIQTQYELKHLYESFQDLRMYVKDSLVRESTRFDSLNKKVTVLLLAVIAQMAGLDVHTLLKIFI